MRFTLKLNILAYPYSIVRTPMSYEDSFTGAAYIDSLPFDMHAVKLTTIEECIAPSASVRIFCPRCLDTD